MSIGKRRHLVTLRSLTEGAPDAFGEPVRAYSTIGTAWAEITPARVQERLLASQVDAQITHTINIGWASEFEILTAKDQVTYDGRTFDIVGVSDPTGLSRELDITALERGL